MATEHNEQTPTAGNEKKPTEFQIEEVSDAGLEQAAGGTCAACGGGCKTPPAIDQQL